MKKFKVLLMGLFFCIGSLTALLTTDLKADMPLDGCGGVGNCYYIPSGCGDGVGCKAYYCTAPSCPEGKDSPGDRCYKCVD